MIASLGRARIRLTQLARVIAEALHRTPPPALPPIACLGALVLLPAWVRAPIIRRHPISAAIFFAVMLSAADISALLLAHVSGAGYYDFTLTWVFLLLVAWNFGAAPAVLLALIVQAAELIHPTLAHSLAFTLPSLYLIKTLNHVLVAGVVGVARGACARVLIQLHDTTQRLHEATRYQTSFMGTAAHELRTPLTALTLALSALSQRLSAMPTPQAPEHVTKLARIHGLLASATHAADRLARLVHAMTDDARLLRTEQLRLYTETVDLSVVLRQTLEGIAEEEGAAPLDVALPNTPLLVNADPDRIAQVVESLVRNARQFSPPARPVRIRAQLASSGAQPVAYIEVSDDGDGMDAAELARVWDRLYQAPSSLRYAAHSHIGLGLGLYITRQILAQHQAEYGARSARGAGSVFWFSLPLLPTLEERAQQEEQRVGQ